ncbi:MAG: dimethylarginine dimethylaminohydrolase family protein [Blastocatellales bacterium]
MLIGLVHKVFPAIADCELTFIEREPINYELAAAQQRDYCRALGECGAQVKMIEANAEFPDACFVEDAAIVLDELAIIARPGAESRRGETAAVAAELSHYRELVFLEHPATLDGGDVLRIERRLFVGRSSRTNLAAIAALSRLLSPIGYEIISVPVMGSLHLKTACTAIDEQTLLVNPQWVSVEAFRDYRLIEVPPDEQWAANVIRIGNTLIAQSGFPKTVELIRPFCERVRQVDISEFRKAEAGLTCLSILFEDSASAA